MSEKQIISYEENLKNIIINSLENSKADNILAIDLAGKTSFAKYMILANGTANKHVLAIAERLANDLKEQGIFDIEIEGKKEASWILVDAGDIIVNIFQPEMRELYSLEKIWDINLAA